MRDPAAGPGSVQSAGCSVSSSLRFVNGAVAAGASVRRRNAHCK